MKKLSAFSVGILFCFSLGSLNASWYPADPFGPGVKSLSLAGAFVALADDLSAVHANPAGLVQLPEPVFSWQILSQLKLQNLIDSKIKLDWDYFPLIGVSLPLIEDELVMALSWTTHWRSLSGKYSVHVLGASVGWKLTPWLSWGNTLGLAIGLADNSDSFGFVWQTGLLAPLSDRLRLGAKISFPVRLTWESLRDDVGVKQVLPLMIQVGIAFRLDEYSILSFDLEFVDLAGMRYSTSEGSAHPDLPKGLFRNFHPHLGFQTLIPSIGLELRCGVMSFTQNAKDGSDSQPALTLGVGAWTSEFFRIDFALQDTLLFDIFVRTNRYERLSISFEYKI